MTADILRFCATMFVFLLHGKASIPGIDAITSKHGWITQFPAWAGVWIFLFLSGYGIGCGFFSGRYRRKDNQCCILSLLRFYLGRFIRIAPPYYFYCLLYLVFQKIPLHGNMRAIFTILTFSYNGVGGINAFGHLWYVSTVMQLYLFMPFFYQILNYIRKINLVLSTFCIVVCGGLLLRIRLYDMSADWYTVIYTNAFMNIDIVLAGMMVAQLKTNYQIKEESIGLNIVKYLTWVVFIGVILYNCFIYSRYSIGDLRIYRCILPTVYICIISVLLMLSGIHNNKNYGPVRKLTQTVISQFCSCSYAFYIFHVSVFSYLENTLVVYNRYLLLDVKYRYIVFFTVSFLLTMALAIPTTTWGKTIVKKYNQFIGRKTDVS